MINISQMEEMQKEKKKYIAKVRVLCLNNPEELAEYEKIINGEEVMIERTFTHFTPDGRFFVAVFYSEPM